VVSGAAEHVLLHLAPHGPDCTSTLNLLDTWRKNTQSLTSRCQIHGAVGIYKDNRAQEAIYTFTVVWNCYMSSLTAICTRSRSNLRPGQPGTYWRMSSTSGHLSTQVWA